jgi:hypothetical protein
VEEIADERLGLGGLASLEQGRFHRQAEQKAPPIEKAARRARPGRRGRSPAGARRGGECGEIAVPHATSPVRVPGFGSEVKRRQATSREPDFTSVATALDCLVPHSRRRSGATSPENALTPVTVRPPIRIARLRLLDTARIRLALQIIHGAFDGVGRGLGRSRERRLDHRHLAFLLGY